MNPQTYIAPMRTYIGGQLTTLLPEMGHGEDLADVTASTLYAYRLGEVSVEHHTPAVNDSTYRIPVSLCACVKEANGAAEAASVCRSALSGLAANATNFRSWETVPAGLVAMDVEGGPYVGSGDEWEEWLASRGQNWVAGHVDVVMVVMTGYGA